MTPMKHEPPSIKRRGRKNLPPEKLYETLCAIFPEQIAAEKFEHLMGYAPPEAWRKPQPPLTITISEDEKHETTD